MNSFSPARKFEKLRKLEEDEQDCGILRIIKSILFPSHYKRARELKWKNGQ